VVILTDNKRYTKIDEYEALLKKKKKNSIKSVEYEEKLIKYNEDYESYNSYLD